MKKVMLSMLMLAAFTLSACGPVSGATTEGAFRVLAVESFLADIAQNVAGDRVVVERLMPLGMDPHTYEPTPQDVRKIAESSVLIVNGAGFETWLEKTLENAGGERLVIEASTELTSRTAREGEAAVMSVQEKAEAVCTELDGVAASETIAAGSDAASAAEIHHAGDGHAHEAELISLALNASGGAFGGMVKLDVAEDGEYILAASGGTLSVTDAGGGLVAVEDSLPVDCAGLNSGILLDLSPGEYFITLSGLDVDTTPFFAGPAGAHGHGEVDPHFWLDPTLAVMYVENIRDGLIAADPEGSEVYTRNAAAYIAELQDLDAWIQGQVQQVAPERRLIVTNHESFGYFADRYGFTIIGTIIPSMSSAASPSAQQMARLIDHIRETGATAIFIETGASPNLAEQVSAETGVKVVTGLYTHSVTEAGGEAPTYIDMMKFNVNTIVSALK